MKKVASVVLSITLLMTALPGTVSAGGRTDLPDVTGHWAEADIRAAAEAGWVNGYPDGTFKPEGPVTRAEFLKMLSMVRSNASAIADQRLAFFDTNLTEKEHWAVAGGYVKNALAQGILEPSDYPVAVNDQHQVTGWTLNPDLPVTRLDATVLINRALGNKYQAESFWYHPGSQFSPRVPEPASYYQESLPAWAKGWVAIATNSGLVNGYPDGTFKPTQTVKRSEAVVMLRRLANKVATPWRPTSILEAPATPYLKSLDNLYYLNFTPVLTLQFDIGTTWDETAEAWASLSREDRASTVKEYADDFWAEARANGYFPLDVRSLMVTVVGQTNQGLGEGHFDGTTYEYLDVNGNATPANPNKGIDLKAHLKVVPGSEDLQAQFERYKENARVNYQANPPQPSLVYTLPYQYLGDWFRTDANEVIAFARGRADECFQATKTRLAAVGVDLRQVTFQIAPSDTADRAGQYRGLLIGQTLLRNPVLTATYDGQNLTVISRPATLQEYVANIKPEYEWVPVGEAGGEERVDPEPAVARQVMETFLYTLGQQK